MARDDNHGNPSAVRASVLVSVDDDHVGDLAGMADRLSGLGMYIEGTMELLGTLTGYIEPAKIDVIRAVEGVSDVEMSRSYQLPPPGSPIQ